MRRYPQFRRLLLELAHPHQTPTTPTTRHPTVFLTISTTGTPERPATDLGFLLHKHPDKSQAFSTSYGNP
ncbi:hypothetical protein PV740_17560 [Streptomyces europaeiscabiei]|nr:hypothetical protein [Streptomyces europaeiscabiei]MDX3583526.1 hypothetical protein [Streptomyces europaeiscabiei]